MSTEVMTKEEVTHTAAEPLVDATNAYKPDVDIFYTPESVVFLMDLPGIKPGQVTVEIDEKNNLFVRAKTDYSEQERNVYRQFKTGNYYRSFSLNDEIDRNRVEARLENGVLELVIQKREAVKPRKIEIKA